MKVDYRRTWNQSYMILKEVGQYQEYEIKMFEYNEMDGLLPLEIFIEDGEIHFGYEITGKQALGDLLEQQEVETELLKNILCECIHICRVLEQYLLDENRLLLSVDYIFFDNKSKRLYFCYQPGRKGDLKKSFRGLMEELLQKLDHSQEENVKTAYELYERTTEDNYSLLDLQTVFYQHSNIISCQENNSFEQEPEESKKIGQTAVSELPKHEKSLVFKEKFRYKKDTMLFDVKKGFQKWIDTKKSDILCYSGRQNQEEDISEQAEEVPQKEQAKLLYLGQGEEEDFLIDSDKFWIGTQGGQANAQLTSQALEKIHAKLEKKEDGYYIEDMNSANGTMINGELLAYKDVRRLRNGDRITFADVSYRFLTF